MQFSANFKISKIFKILLSPLVKALANVSKVSRSTTP